MRESLSSRLFEPCAEVVMHLRRTDITWTRAWVGRPNLDMTHVMGVLVVEDYRSLADLVAEGLPTRAWPQTWRTTGTQAIRLTVNAYDVVGMDWELRIHGDARCRWSLGDKR